jgi:hypothetical protein
MKKIIFSLIIVLTTSTTFAQTQLKKNEASTIVNSQKKQNDVAVSYRLFPTQNMWTFIKLNTRNGQLWQVQWSTETNKRFESNLSLTPLVDTDKEANERFTLYPTQNIYTFILLDQLDGRMWQVQWSTEANNRFIIPIE